MKMRVMTICATVLLFCCSSDKRAWEVTAAEDTREAYLQFLVRFPESEFAPEARSRLSFFREQSDWELANTGGTIDSYESFLQKWPTGANSPEAIRVLSSSARIHTKGFVINDSGEVIEKSDVELTGFVDTPEGYEAITGVRTDTGEPSVVTPLQEIRAIQVDWEFSHKVSSFTFFSSEGDAIVNSSSISLHATAATLTIETRTGEIRSLRADTIQPNYLLLDTSIEGRRASLLLQLQSFDLQFQGLEEQRNFALLSYSDKPVVTYFSRLEMWSQSDTSAGGSKERGDSRTKD